MYGDDYEYADSRLAGTIVRLGDEPVMVGHVNADMTVDVSFLKDFGPVVVVKLSDLNLKPVPLGMCNVGGTANYLARMPKRNDWKQGLRKGNFLSFGDVEVAYINPAMLRDTIVCNYPTLAECFEKVKKDSMAMAWCRDWAVTRGGYLLYKMYQEVGKITPQSHVLSPGYTYLEEALQEVL